MSSGARIALDPSKGGSTQIGATVRGAHRHGMRLVHGSHRSNSLKDSVTAAGHEATEAAHSMPRSRALGSAVNPQLHPRGLIGQAMRPVEFADTWFNRFSMVMLPAFLLQLPGGALGFIGRKINSPGMVRWSERMSLPMHKLLGGSETVKPWVVADIPHMASGAAKKVANAVERTGMGGVAKTIRGAADHLAPMEGHVSAGIAAATHGAAGQVGRVAGAVERSSPGFMRGIERVTPGLKAGALKGVESKVGNAFKGVGQMPVGHFLWRGGTITSTAVSSYNSARDLHADLGALRKVYASQLGTRPENISNWKLMFGKASPLISRERHILVARYGLNAIAIALGVKLGWNIDGGKGMMTALVLQLGITSLTPKLAQNSILPAYRAVEEGQMLGAQLTAEHYAPLVAAAASTGRMVLDAENRNVIAIAAQYANEHASAKQVLDEARNGKLAQRRAELEKPKAPTALANPNEVRASKPVQGLHTGKVVSQAVAAVQSPDSQVAPAGGR